MRRAPALDNLLSRVPERQGAPRSIPPPLVTVAETDYSPSGGGGQAKSGGLAVLRAPGISRPSSWTGTRHDLVHGRRRLGLLRRAEAQVREDLLDGYLVVEVGHDLGLPPALATRERVSGKTFAMRRAQLAVQRRFLAGFSSTLPSPGSSAARSPRTGSGM